MFKMWRRQREIRSVFSRFLTQEQVDAIARSPEKLDLTFSVTWLHCLLIQVRDDTPEDTQRNVAQIVPICLNNDGVIFDLMASIQLVGFGKLFRSDKTQQEYNHNSLNASSEILGCLGSNVRIVSFCGDIPYGNFGGDRRLAFTIAPPKFDRFMAALLDTKFGQITVAQPL
jgi:hypothetical protein